MNKNRSRGSRVPCSASSSALSWLFSSIPLVCLAIFSLAIFASSPRARAAGSNGSNGSDGSDGSDGSKEPPRLTLFLNVGLTAASASQSTYTLGSGTQVQSTDTRDDMSRFLEAELNYRVTSFFSISPLFQGVSYNRSDGAANDRELSLMLVPRLQTGDTGLTFWAGCGFGGTLTQLGQSNFVGTGLNYELNRTALGVAMSPRVGMDYILDGFVLGVEVSYTDTQGSFSGTATDPVVGRSDPVTEQLSRNWWAAAARFGFQL